MACGVAYGLYRLACGLLHGLPRVAWPMAFNGLWSLAWRVACSIAYGLYHALCLRAFVMACTMADVLKHTLLYHSPQW